MSSNMDEAENWSKVLPVIQSPSMERIDQQTYSPENSRENYGKKRKEFGYVEWASFKTAGKNIEKITEKH